MFTRICEPITLLGVFDDRGFQPKKFRWRGQLFKIDEVTLISKTIDGGVHQKEYSVMANATLFRLKYIYLDEAWLLEEIWCE